MGLIHLDRGYFVQMTFGIMVKFQFLIIPGESPSTPSHVKSYVLFAQASCTGLSLLVSSLGFMAYQPL